MLVWHKLYFDELLLNSIPVGFHVGIFFSAERHQVLNTDLKFTMVLSPFQKNTVKWTTYRSLYLAMITSMSTKYFKNNVQFINHLFFIFMYFYSLWRKVRSIRVKKTWGSEVLCIATALKLRYLHWYCCLFLSEKLIKKNNKVCVCVCVCVRVRVRACFISP